jgi:hypothetical protein
MDAQNLDLIKALSYAFYGICLLVAALIGVVIKIALNMKNSQKEDTEKQINEVRLKEKEKSETALKFQGLSDKVISLEKRQKETTDWIDEIVKKMDAGFEKLESLLREALKK